MVYIPTMHIKTPLDFQREYETLLASQQARQVQQQQMQLAQMKQEALMREQQQAQQQQQMIADMYAQAEKQRQDYQAAMTAQKASPVLQNAIGAMGVLGGMPAVPDLAGTMGPTPVAPKDAAQMVGDKLMAMGRPKEAKQYLDMAGGTGNVYRKAWDALPAKMQERVDPEFLKKVFPDIEFKMAPEGTSYKSEMEFYLKDPAGFSAYKRAGRLPRVSASGVSKGAAVPTAPSEFVPGPYARFPGDTEPERRRNRYRWQFKKKFGKFWYEDPDAFGKYVGEQTLLEGGFEGRKNERAARDKVKEAGRRIKAVTKREKEFRDNKVVKDYINSANAVNRIRTLADAAKRALIEDKTGPAAANSMAALFSFIQGLDNSVVRASEIGAFKEMVAVIERFRGFKQALAQGGLTPAMLEGLVSGAESNRRGGAVTVNQLANGWRNSTRDLFPQWPEEWVEVAGPYANELVVVGKKESAKTEQPKKKEAPRDVVPPTGGSNIFGDW